MEYVTFADDGTLTGGYIQPLHPSHEANHIAVTPEQCANWTLYRANAARTGLELVPESAQQTVVPEWIPKLNARLVLISAGYWDDVVAFTAEQGPVAVAFLEDAQTVRRDNLLVNAWAAARGKTGELDGLFIAGAALNVDEFHG